MTLLEELPRGSSTERSIPVLETKRLVLRAPRLEDAKAIAVLANDRRIAEGCRTQNLVWGQILGHHFHDATAAGSRHDNDLSAVRLVAIW